MRMADTVRCRWPTTATAVCGASARDSRTYNLPLCPISATAPLQVGGAEPSPAIATGWPVPEVPEVSALKHGHYGCVATGQLRGAADTWLACLSATGRDHSTIFYPVGLKHDCHSQAGPSHMHGRNARDSNWQLNAAVPTLS
jgi:hypothetical protein